MKSWYFNKVLIFAVLVSLYSGLNNYSTAQAVNSDKADKSFRLFEDDGLLELTLKFDMTTYFRVKPQEDYLKANITFHINKTDSVSKDIRLRTRGVFRNSYCMFPPIELNFKKVQFGFSDLDKISKIKVTTECVYSSQNKVYILKEYLAYKLFNVLTDTSFRVRLLSINYIDTKKKRKLIRAYGFFIEPVETLMARTNSVEIKSKSLDQKSIVPTVMDRLAIFNYMIGNYDWAVPGRHNILVLKPLVLERTYLPIAIPFDFDWTGLVNASYAIPAEITGTQTVRERIFLGVCRKEEVFRKDLVLFSEKKAEFYRVINEFPYMSREEKKVMTDYLDEFFDQLNGNKNKLISTLLNSCKNF